MDLGDFLAIFQNILSVSHGIGIISLIVLLDLMARMAY
jgi:hypothetical protein